RRRRMGRTRRGRSCHVRGMRAELAQGPRSEQLGLADRALSRAARDTRPHRCRTARYGNRIAAPGGGCAAERSAGARPARRGEASMTTLELALSVTVLLLWLLGGWAVLVGVNANEGDERDPVERAMILTLWPILAAVAVAIDLVLSLLARDPE